jgi:peroxiredoxin-like protein
MTDAPARTNIVRKSFTFHTRVEWAGGRGGASIAEGKPKFRVASPPEFKGEAGVWSPEDLLIQATNACTMATFLAFANRKNLPLESYASDASGTLEFVEKSYQFTRIEIRVKMGLGPEGSIEEARQILHDAHAACLISNSINAKVVVEADIARRNA